MKENGQFNRSIAPRPRPGEVIPPAPEGMVPTRFRGKIVFVSAPGPGELFIGNSPYTHRQVNELAAIEFTGKPMKYSNPNADHSGSW